MSHRLPITLMSLLLCLSLGTGSPSAAEPAQDADGSDEIPASVPVGLASPRATMETFLSAMNDIKRGDPERIEDAITTLDLQDVNTLVRRERGIDLAWMLLDVMDRTRLVELERVPARAAAEIEDVDHLGGVDHREDGVDVVAGEQLAKVAVFIELDQHVTLFGECPLLGLQLRDTSTQFTQARLQLLLFGFQRGDLAGVAPFFNDTATTEIYTLSLHDALPICVPDQRLALAVDRARRHLVDRYRADRAVRRGLGRHWQRRS